MKNFRIAIILFGLMVGGNVIAMNKPDINVLFSGFDQIEIVESRIKDLQVKNNQLCNHVSLLEKNKAAQDVYVILEHHKEQIAALEKTVGDQKDQIEELYAMIDITHEALEKEVTKNSKKRN